MKSCPGGEFAVGSKVAALMGGLGRTINGSYAEYTRAIVNGVVQLESELPWEELATLPESYATAWTCLLRNLELVKGQTLLIRGATSSFGLAALHMSGGRRGKGDCHQSKSRSLQQAGGSWRKPSGVGGPELSHRRGQTD